MITSLYILSTILPAPIRAEVLTPDAATIRQPDTCWIDGYQCRDTAIGLAWREV